MTDYLNPHHIYPDDISRRIDIAPGFDSFRDTATDGKPHPDNGVPTVKESLTTEPTQIDRIKKLEKEVEQLKKYFERFAYRNRLGLPEVEG